jgi:hypothetical protein
MSVRLPRASRMTLGLIALLLAFVASGIAPGVASADTTHRYTSKLKNAPLVTRNDYPNVGGTALLAGSVKVRSTRPCRPSCSASGALVDRVRITGQPQPNVFAFRARERIFFVFGTVRDRSRGTATVLADGSQQLVIRGRFTGGTGAYRGASGRFRARGTIPPGSTVFTGRSRGRISY